MWRTMFFFELTGFFFNDTATTEIYTLSLHDALPISMNCKRIRSKLDLLAGDDLAGRDAAEVEADRKSTRLNSSHVEISYAVFCLKNKKGDPRWHNKWLSNRSIPSGRDAVLAIDLCRP